MTSTIHITAQRSVLPDGKLGDASLSGQLKRITSRPLETDHKKSYVNKSLRSAGEFIVTVPREGYREFKNFLVLGQKLNEFVRTFFETLFREAHSSWGEVKKVGKDVLSAAAAMPVRVITLVCDLTRLGLGILIPAASVKTKKIEGEVDIDTDGDGIPETTIEFEGVVKDL